MNISQTKYVLVVSVVVSIYVCWKLLFLSVFCLINLGLLVSKEQDAIMVYLHSIYQTENSKNY